MEHGDVFSQCLDLWLNVLLLPPAVSHDSCLSLYRLTSSYSLLLNIFLQCNYAFKNCVIILNSTYNRVILTYYRVILTIWFYRIEVWLVVCNYASFIVIVITVTTCNICYKDTVK